MQMQPRNQSAFEIVNLLRETDVDALALAPTRAAALVQLAEVAAKVDALDAGLRNHPRRSETARLVQNLRFHLRAVAGVDRDEHRPLHHAGWCIHHLDSLATLITSAVGTEREQEG